jgi:8-oxo-dGTP pyrophosphatase MutT (NUDIX family)
MTDSNDQPLTVPFRGGAIPITHPNVSRELTEKALQSDIFQTWLSRTARDSHDTEFNRTKHMALHGVEIQSVDMFGARRVGFVKLKADSSLVVNGISQPDKLPGIAMLRGNAVAVVVALHCEGENVQVILVEQARIPIGTVSCLELPAGMIDDEKDTMTGTAAKELEEECGFQLKPSELINLTDLAFEQAEKDGHIPYRGVSPSPGGSDEFIGLCYVEKKVTAQQLKDMRGRLLGKRGEGEHITLRVVPYEQAWRMSADCNCLSAMFLIDRLRSEGKLPPAGEAATPLC